MGNRIKNRFIPTASKIYAIRSQDANNLSDSEAKLYAAFYDADGRCLGVKMAASDETYVDIPESITSFNQCVANEY